MMRKKTDTEKLSRRVVCMLTVEQYAALEAYTAELQKAIGSEVDISVGHRSLLRKGIEAMQGRTPAELTMIRTARLSLRSIADCTTAPVHDEDKNDCGCSSCVAARTLLKMDAMGKIEELVG